MIYLCLDRPVSLILQCYWYPPLLSNPLYEMAHSPGKDYGKYSRQIQVNSSFLIDIFNFSMKCYVILPILNMYRWFALFYLLMMFFLIPLYIFGLSLAGPVAMYIGLVPIGLITFVVVIINLLQNKIPEKLPPKLQNWDFLPLWMRSLDPLDK